MSNIGNDYCYQVACEWEQLFALIDEEFNELVDSPSFTPTDLVITQFFAEVPINILVASLVAIICNDS